MNTEPTSTRAPGDKSVSAAPSHWGRSARDTIEAFAIAFALAFLFKAFEAEAFIIPTGSMAPTLMGRHKDVVCPECGYAYTASCSEETDRNGNLLRTPGGAIDERFQVVECTCPNCRSPMSVDPRDALDGEFELQKSYSGDRIWVSKAPYQFAEPRRWDVIVFRCPVEAEIYFIKRLVGLPNETLRIQHGDIFVRPQGAQQFDIARKPPDKVLAMAQVVHDNDYVSTTLDKFGWPARWSETDQAAPAWNSSDQGRHFATDGTAAGPRWLRYRHRVPPENLWRRENVSAAQIERMARPQLITDFYAFNTRVLRRDRDYGMVPSTLGLHWVGDLLVECEAEVQSNQGKLLLDLVRGGRHFTCVIDVSSGQAQLQIEGLPAFQPRAETPLLGPGRYQLRFANVDRQLLLWVNGRLIAFDAPTAYDSLDNDRPVSTAGDPGDLAPVGLGSEGAAVAYSHLRVLRDIYYISDGGQEGGMPITDFRARNAVVPYLRTSELIDFLSTPALWQARGRNAFDDRQGMEFELREDQFFVLGDNSPASADARFWYGEHFVDRRLLVGKALLIYWPHPLDLPIPFTGTSLGVVPNIPNMHLIR